MASHRVSRGRESQVWLAEHFREAGWVNAESRAASLPGTDVLGMPGWAPEVKATEKENLTGALRQAAKNSGGDIPFVVYRPRGYGREKIGQWIVALDLSVFTELMKRIEGFE